MLVSSNQPFALMRSTSECSDRKPSTDVKNERSGVWKTICGARSVK